MSECLPDPGYRHPINRRRRDPPKESLHAAPRNRPHHHDRPVARAVEEENLQRVASTTEEQKKRAAARGRWSVGRRHDRPGPHEHDPRERHLGDEPEEPVRRDGPRPLSRHRALKRANRLRLRAHDMRAFFVTAAMYAGKDALWITDRSGHATLGTLRTYERDVRRWRELGEAPVDVAEAIPEFAATSVAAEVAAPADKPGPPIAVAMRKCTGGESNPYALRRRNLKPTIRRRPRTITRLRTRKRTKANLRS
jgi:hypothetical protein